jgi:HEAT repeat protein
MREIRKGYNSKAISILISIVLLCNSSLYSYPAKDSLRAPISKTNLEERMNKAMLDRFIKVLKDILDDKKEDRGFIIDPVLDELGKIKDEKKVIEILKDIFEDENRARFIRIRAAEALGNIGTEEALQVLGNALGKETDALLESGIPAILGERGKEGEELLIKALEEGENVWTRVEAAIELGKVKSEKAVEPLFKALKYDAELVKYNAIYALGSIGGQRAIQGLKESFESLGDKRCVRYFILLTLDRAEKGDAEDIFITALKSQHSDVIGTAIGILGRAGSEKAIEALKNLLTERKYSIPVKKIGPIKIKISLAGEELGEELPSSAWGNIERRHILVKAVESIGKIGGEKGIAALKYLRDHHEDEEVRIEASRVLEETEKRITQLPLTDIEYRKTKKPETTIRLRALKEIKELIELSKDKRTSKRVEAAIDLGRLGTKEAMDRLIILARKDKSPYVRRQAVDCLRKIGTEEIEEVLIRVLKKDRDWRVRMKAVSALGRLKSEKALEQLIITFKTDKEEDVRIKAATVLKAIKSEKAVEPLISIFRIKNQSQDMKMLVLEILTVIEDERALKVLIEALENDKDKAIREQAARSMGWIKKEEAVGSLIMAFRLDVDREVREEAAWALGEISTEEAIDALMENLEFSTKGAIKTGVLEVLSNIVHRHSRTDI